MSDYVLGQDIGNKIIKALGLKGSIRSIVFDFTVEQLATIQVEHFVTSDEGDRLLKVLDEYAVVPMKLEGK